MDPRFDPLQTQLRRALRVGLSGVATRPGVRGAPVVDGPASPAASVLSELSALWYEQPVSEGGLGLGLIAGATVSEELGRAACGNPYRGFALLTDAAKAAGRRDLLDDLRSGATAAVAGLETLTGGPAAISAVPAVGGPAGGKVVLTGTVTADAASADLLAVGCWWQGSPALAIVPAGSAGYKWLGDSWPHAVQLTDVTVDSRDLVTDFDAGSQVLARARIRQAAYLLGLAAGMHESAVRYTGTRRQFGSRLRDYQGIGFPLARCAVSLRAARMSVYRAAWLAESAGSGDLAGSGGWGEPALASVEALALASETMIALASIAMQVCGGRGMTSEVAVQRYYRLAAAEPFRYGKPGELWRLVGAARLARLP